MMRDLATRPWARWVSLATLCATNLMVALDALVMLVAVPTVQADLDIAPQNTQWIITSYALAFGGLLLLGGRIGDYNGRKAAFLVGVTGFTAASALGGAAQNSAMLFAGRGFVDPSWGYLSRLAPAFAILGVGVLVIYVASTAAVMSGSDDDDAGVVSAVLNAFQQIGSALGPAIVTTLSIEVTKRSTDGPVPTTDDVLDGHHAAFAAPPRAGAFWNQNNVKRAVLRVLWFQNTLRSRAR